MSSLDFGILMKNAYGIEIRFCTSTMYLRATKNENHWVVYWLDKEAWSRNESTLANQISALTMAPEQQEKHLVYCATNTDVHMGTLRATCAYPTKSNYGDYATKKDPSQFAKQTSKSTIRSSTIAE
eukprot:gb/GECG01006941.1/.p1 GENE.gb/GECG01006941.1/~~gb/GECG01006941.1/.p1  ORF type:complete len:126 (+),score=11.71 gb/GECG01006941.1/:1-378(+)